MGRRKAVHDDGGVWEVVVVESMGTEVVVFRGTKPEADEARMSFDKDGAYRRVSLRPQDA